MLVIKLFRTGKKNQPFFKIVVTDKNSPPRGGRFVEELGFLNPLTKQRSIKSERAQYWISKGAQPSDSVYNILVSEKVIEGKKRSVHAKKKGEEKTEEQTKDVQEKPVEKKEEIIETNNQVEAVKEEKPAQETKEQPVQEPEGKEEDKKTETTELKNQEETPEQEKPEEVKEQEDKKEETSNQEEVDKKE